MLSMALHRGLQLFQEGALAACTDGRLSAGPLDLTEFLAQQPVQEVRRPGSGAIGDVEVTCMLGGPEGSAGEALMRAAACSAAGCQAGAAPPARAPGGRGQDRPQGGADAALRHPRVPGCSQGAILLRARGALQAH